MVESNCPSAITADNRLPLLCTLGAGHPGPHIAGVTGGGAAAAWLTATPRSGRP